MKKSYVQVYTGNGKGKTTAAMGLAVRAAGRGLSVKIVQFLKGRDTGEMAALEKIGGIAFVRASQCKKFFHELSEQEKCTMRENVSALLPVIDGWLNDADVLILDEAMAAMACGVLKQEEVLRIIDQRGKTEIVLTGRDAPQAILHKAHLVTEMREIKHYYNAGAGARRGIEY